MKRPLLVTLLVLSSGPVYAEWVVLSPSDSAGGYAVYVDPDTIRREGEMVTMWHLADFQTRQTVNEASFLSLKMQAQYDCNTSAGGGRRLRTSLAIWSFYSLSRIR